MQAIEIERETQSDASPVMHLDEVLALTRRSYVTIWRWLKNDQSKFPKPIANWPGNALVWRRRDVLAFIEGGSA